jgi:dTDP-4-dehydrorhamnose reductase
MRVLLTGAAGVVGRELWRHLRERKIDVIATDIAEFPDVVRADLRNAEAVCGLMEKAQPDVLLHLAANKNVFFCEENPAVAHDVNYRMSETLARACANSGVRMVFFSSDYVFGAEDRMWRETDIPCPTTQYGRDKASSEAFICRHLANYAIIRTAGLYGFSGDLTHVVRSALSKGDSFKAFSNLVNCPTWTGDLFAMLDSILGNRPTGVFHCVGPEALSRFDYACRVAAAFGLDGSLVQAETLDFSKDIRPPSLRMDGSATFKALGVFPGRLEDNLMRVK